MASTRFLPMFPLRIVVFPGEKLNLHIFEPRYKQLVGECESQGITFGIPAFIDNKLAEIGTEIRLLSIEKRHENGEMDICTEGIGLFKVVDFYTQAVGKMYGAADVIDLPKTDSVGNFLLNEEILTYTIELFQILNIHKKLPESAATLKTYDIAHYVGFTVEQEYEFLCIGDESLRQNYMLSHLKRIMPVVQEVEHLRQRALLNGHFKNIIPPKI